MNASSIIYHTLIPSNFYSKNSIFIHLGKSQAVDQITNRIKDNRWPQLLIFPQGTCTSQNVLTTFKRGAFVAGEPCQPIVLKYPFQHFDSSWVGSMPTLDLLWRQLCQFHVPLSVEYLPVYYPNEEEKSNPMLYAKNVRAAMAHRFDNVTEHAGR